MNASKVHHQQQHRKKKYVQEERAAPFPVPIASITRDAPSKNYWYQYLGQIQGNHVLINYSGDISYLCKMGFFGKGLTSKFSHTVYSKLPYVHLPSGEGRDPDVVQVMRRRMYLKHMKWKKSHDLRSANRELDETASTISVASEDVEFNSDAEDIQQGTNREKLGSDMTGIVQMVNTDLQHADNTLATSTGSLHSDPTTQVESGNNANSESVTLSQTLDKASTSQNLNGDPWANSTISSKIHGDPWANSTISSKMHGDPWANSTISSKIHGDPWANSTISSKMHGDPCANSTAADTWDAMEADEEFWTAEESSKSRDTKLSNNSKSGDDIYDSEAHSPAKRVKLASDAGNRTDLSERLDNKLNSVSRLGVTTYPVATAEHALFPQQEHTGESRMGIGELKKSNNETGALTKTNQCVGEMESSELKKSNNETDVLTKTNQCVGEMESSELNISHNETDALTKTNQPCVGEMEISELNKSHNETDILTKTKQAKNVEIGRSVQQVSNNCADMLGCPPEHIHPYCRRDDEEDDGDDDITGEHDYLVIDDSDLDDHAEVLHKENYVWKPVRKKEAFHFIEPLVLSFEEAYFLSYGLGCLTVQDECSRKLTLADLWCKFCTRRDFLPRYVAYHYFRSKGWVPKPCSLFGTDFLVYKVGPEFYHASYSVIIRTVYEGSYEEVEGYNQRKQTWTSFSGLHRITENVAKTLVYCYIIMPSDLSEEEKRSPDCIKRIRARLQMVHRWVSSQERDKDRMLEDIS